MKTFVASLMCLMVVGCASPPPAEGTSGDEPKAVAYVKTLIVDGCKLNDRVRITDKHKVAWVTVDRPKKKKWVVEAEAKPGYAFVEALGGETTYRKVYRLTNNKNGCL